MKIFFALFTLLHFWTYSQNSNGLEICNEYQKIIKEFSANKEAETALDEILSEIGAAKNFFLIPCDEINNALAVTFKGERFILYDKEFITRLNKATSNWSGKFILAHEVGHHINGHTRDFLISSILDEQTKSKQREEELEADEFAGFVMSRLGVDFNQIYKLIDVIATENDDKYSTHPNKSKRIKAIKKGFNKANVQLKVNNPANTAQEFEIISPKNEKINKKREKENISHGALNVNLSNLTKEDRLDYEKERANEISRANGSKFDLWIPHDINLFVLFSTGKLIFEWMIYFIIFIYVIIYSYKSSKIIATLKKRAAREIIFLTVGIVFGIIVFFIPDLYNKSENNRILTSVTSTIKKDWSQLDDELSRFGFRGNHEEIVGNRVQLSNGSETYLGRFQYDFYSYGGNEYSQWDVDSAAKNLNLDVRTYISRYKIKKKRKYYHKIERARYNRHLMEKNSFSYILFAPEVTVTKKGRLRGSPTTSYKNKIKMDGHEFFIILDTFIVIVILRLFLLCLFWSKNILKSEKYITKLKM